MYRSLWQAQDHLGLPRTYPATLMQCAGRIIRGDHWWADDFAHAMIYIGTSLWARPYRTVIAQQSMGSFFFTYGGIACNGSSLWRWFFTWHQDATRNCPWYVVCTDAYTAGFPSMRLYDGYTVNLTSAPWYTEQLKTTSLLICQSSTGTLDNIWHNSL